MNEEERINRSIKYIINQNYVDTEDDIIGILIKALNLIKKQSKEIEELKDFITKLQATKDRLDSYDKENTLEEGYKYGVQVENENILRNLDEYLYKLDEKRKNGEIVIGYWQVKDLINQLKNKFKIGE